MGLKELVQALLDQDDPEGAKDLRKAFYRNPRRVMQAKHLTNEEQAILFTMDRDLIASRTGLWDIIQTYEMDSDWDAQGRDEPLPKPDDADWLEAPAILAELPLGPVAGLTRPRYTTRGGWGDPGPHGRGFEPSRVFEGEIFRLVLVGEGFLGTASIHFEPVHDGGPVDPVKVDGIVFRNFRRIYLRTPKIKIAKPGGYRLKIANHPDLDPKWALPAGQLLEVEEVQDGR